MALTEGSIQEAIGGERVGGGVSMQGKPEGKKSLVIQRI